MIAFWVFHIISGGLPQGIRTLENGGYIAFHITAESLTGFLCVVGGLGIALSLNWGNLLALFASGMLAYTGINSLAWNEVKEKPGLSIMFLVPTVIAVATFIYLFSSLLM